MLSNLMKKLRIDLGKNTKFGFYLRGLFIYIIPSFLYKKDFEKKFDSLSREEQNYILDRVNYYNKLENSFILDNSSKTIKKFINKEKKKTYYFDLLEHVKHFDLSKKIAYIFGDVTAIPDTPSIVKSRPINGDNKNSVIMKLNKVRHFIFVNDAKEFEDKKDMLVWRGGVGMPSRIAFMEKYFDHPMCDVGQTNKKKNIDKFGHPEWQKEKMSLKEQLEYKFLLSIEGNDVASNLKWAMSSNSLVFMKKPIYETWFMEGKLIADYHYVLLNDDFSNLVQKMEFYSKNIDKAKEIINNANRYVQEFQNEEKEELISYMVLDKYFRLSQQNK